MTSGYGLTTTLWLRTCVDGELRMIRNIPGATLAGFLGGYLAQFQGALTRGTLVIGRANW